MSTFRGIVSEFPNIRIDFFRRADGLLPPLACFLSHIHSDHLMGLESLKAPFVYCSPATREILLRLEKYPSRMNFTKGILETRRQTYRHLSKLLKTIPLETPTVIELSPGKKITVTLFDANHCVGAVMFLIEGNGKAILYTGDIRSEDWWLRSLCNNPILLPYAMGIKTLDNVYLDTTFATKEKLYRNFPSKATGVAELLKKVALYPSSTTFYFHSWTFGYENVWIALSAFLQTKIHLDVYRWSLYRAMKHTSEGPGCPEVDSLCGFSLGNHFSPGCLTDADDVRIHSCERGAGCKHLSRDLRIVTILPVITRRDDGIDVHELGIGGGKGDLDQVQEVDMHDHLAVNKLLELCSGRIEDTQTLEKVQTLLETCSKSRQARMKLDTHINGLDFDGLEEETKLTAVVDELATLVSKSPPTTGQNSDETHLSSPDFLPDIITFPYSRHSSYFELRAFVEAFKPKEIFPCTVDERNWNRHVSMEALFGDLCSGSQFQHDEEMLSRTRAWKEQTSQHSIEAQQTQESDLTTHEDNSSQISALPDGMHLNHISTQLETDSYLEGRQKHLLQSDSRVSMEMPQQQITPNEAIPSSEPAGISPSKPAQPADGTQGTRLSISPPPIKRKLRPSQDDEFSLQVPKVKRERSVSQWAFEAADSGTWNDFGGLVCARSAESQELGFSDSD